MNFLTAENFNEFLDKEIQNIDHYYPKADNFELALLAAHKTCLQCIKNKGYSYIMKNKENINDCNSNYLNYNTLTWEEIINKIIITK